MNLTGFDDHTIEHFKEFSFAQDAQDWKYLKINGVCFGNPQHIYWVLPFGKGNFNVQVAPIEIPECFRYGIVFTWDVDKDACTTYPYHPPM
jgi:hypothetical protein